MSILCGALPTPSHIHNRVLLPIQWFGGQNSDTAFNNLHVLGLPAPEEIYHRLQKAKGQNNVADVVTTQFLASVRMFIEQLQALGFVGCSLEAEFFESILA